MQMKSLQAYYQTGKILLITAVFLIGSVLFYILPASEGRMAGVFRNQDGLTVLGMLILIVFLVLSFLFITYSIRAIFRLPSLKSDGEVLFVYLVPFKKIYLSSVDHVIVKTDSVEIFTRNNKKIKINTKLITGADEFFRGIGISTL